MATRNGYWDGRKEAEMRKMDNIHLCNIRTTFIGAFRGHCPRLKAHETPHTSTEISRLPRTLYWSPGETPKVDLENDDPKFEPKLI